MDFHNIVKFETTDLALENGLSFLNIYKTWSYTVDGIVYIKHCVFIIGMEPIVVAQEDMWAELEYELLNMYRMAEVNFLYL